MLQRGETAAFGEKRAETQSEAAQPIAIAFACDENYAPYLPVVARSLLENTGPEQSGEIIIMDCCADPQASAFAKMQAELEADCAAQGHFSLKIIRVREELAKTGFLERNAAALRRYGYGTYARLLIPDLLSAYDKVLYLDIDHIVLGDIADIFALPPGDALIAAVPDISAAHARLSAKSQRKQLIEGRLGLTAEQYYCIASPMLFNISACCAFDFTAKTLVWLERDSALRFPDQDAINAVCKGRIFYLPQKWGRVNGSHFRSFCRELRRRSENERSSALWGTEAENDDICLIHYASAPKPWHGIQPEFSNIWWRYAAKTRHSVDLLFAFLFPAAADRDNKALASCKILGLPVFSVISSRSEKRYSFCKIPFAKYVRGKENRYFYLFGIKIAALSKKPLAEK